MKCHANFVNVKVKRGLNSTFTRDLSQGPKLTF